MAENRAEYAIQHYNQLLAEIQTTTGAFSTKTDSISLDRMNERFRQFADVDYANVNGSVYVSDEEFVKATQTSPVKSRFWSKHPISSN